MQKFVSGTHTFRTVNGRKADEKWFGYVCMVV